MLIGKIYDYAYNVNEFGVIDFFTIKVKSENTIQTFEFKDDSQDDRFIEFMNLSNYDEEYDKRIGYCVFDEIRMKFIKIVPQSIVEGMIDAIRKLKYFFEFTVHGELYNKDIDIDYIFLPTESFDFENLPSTLSFIQDKVNEYLQRIEYYRSLLLDYIENENSVYLYGIKKVEYSTIKTNRKEYTLQFYLTL